MEIRSDPFDTIASGLDQDACGLALLRLFILSQLSRARLISISGTIQGRNPKPKYLNRGGRRYLTMEGHGPIGIVDCGFL